MPWIEGVGDEVTLFFVSISVLIVGAIAWLSTNIGDQPLIRTVLILERRARNREPFDSPQLLAQSPTPTESTQSDTTPLEDVEEFVVESTHQTCESDLSNTAVTGSGENEPNITEADHDGTIVEPHVECYDADCLECRSELNTPERNVITDSAIVQDTCLLTSRRITFFHNRQATLLAQSGPQVEAIETDTAGSVSNAGHIRIRLKYLNDDQKLVEGQLGEQLGDFKRRNFSSELTAQKLIRLIFNGHVLQRDEDTLASYGLFDNCVVHCLVYQHRSATESQAVADGSNAGDVALNRDWHMGSILFVLLSLLLGLAWYCRFQYSHLFNASTTVALIGLTGILTVSLVGIYLPDQDAVR